MDSTTIIVLAMLALAAVIMMIKPPEQGATVTEGLLGAAEKIWGGF